MAIPVVLTDDYVDIDELVSKYHRRKSTLLFLVAALTMIFIGTLGGYTMLQYTTAKNVVYENTVAEFAQVTVESERCIKNPNDPVCVKAQAAIDNKKQTGNGSQKPLDYQIATSYNFYSDPATNIMAILLTQPIILRLQ